MPILWLILDIRVERFYNLDGQGRFGLTLLAQGICVSSIKRETPKRHFLTFGNDKHLGKTRH